MKNLITLIALLAASSALASAATTTVDLVSLVASSTATQVALTNTGTYGTTYTIGGWTGQGSGSASAVTTSDLETVASYISSTGLYYGYGTLGGTSGIATAPSVDATASPNELTISLQARPAYNGTFAVLSVTVSDILSQSDTATIDDLTTISYTYTGTSSSLTAWALTSGSATELTVSNGTIDVSSVSESATIVLLFSSEGNASSGTATFTTTIPEPSTFGLLAGVGALALVASRRRRSRKA